MIGDHDREINQSTIERAMEIAKEQNIELILVGGSEMIPSGETLVDLAVMNRPPIEPIEPLIIKNYRSGHQEENYSLEVRKHTYPVKKNWKRKRRKGHK